MSVPGVIVSIYNMADFLPVILKAFNAQSLKSFEIVFADDGSEDGSCDLITRFPFREGITFQLVAHEDKGFRKCMILNKAVQACRNEYLVFSDGDCIPHKHFLSQHIRHSKPDVLLCGSRGMLSYSLTRKILKTGNISQLNNFRMLFSVTRRKYEGLYLPVMAPLFNMIRKNPRRLGSNFSVHRSDLMRINGFDENYQAPGYGEDIDIKTRLEQTGETLSWVRNQAVQYHLYHQKQPVPNENIRRYEAMIRKKQWVARQGIKKL